MQTQLEIAWHGAEASADMEARIAKRVERVEALSPRLTSCRVTIDAPHGRHRKGNHYEVRIEARGPAAAFVVDRDPGDRNAHEDLHVAVRDAFDALERQIKRWKDAHAGRPEMHVEPLHGRVSALHPERDFGEAALSDGRVVYFHRNAVADDGFAALEVGAAVEVSVDPGEDSENGPHASSVRPVSEISPPTRSG